METNPERAARQAGSARCQDVEEKNLMQIVEEDRLNALREYRILDTEPDESFERITRIVSAALRVPMAAITLVDADRQWFKSRVGINLHETPRSASFCAHTMIGDTTHIPPPDRQQCWIGDAPPAVGRR